MDWRSRARGREPGSDLPLDPLPFRLLVLASALEEVLEHLEEFFNH